MVEYHSTSLDRVWWGKNLLYVMGGTGRTVPTEYLSCCVIIGNEGL